MTETRPSAQIADADELADLPSASRAPRLARPSVFLHAGWRTAGTFLWSRFRAFGDVAGYYEPLHESLATLTPATLAASGPDVWASGHPRLGRPYFDEFAPFLHDARPGVRGYSAVFATDGFFAGPNAKLPALEAYLRRLIEAAHERGEQPVLKFCRSLGRASWMAETFPDSVHIAVVRNPVSQFISAKHQFAAHENPYFLLMPLRVLARNADQDVVAAALHHFAVPLPDAAADEDQARAKAVLLAHLRRTGAEEWYRGFLAFWLLCMLGIPETIDAVIDADLLSVSAVYQTECAADLAVLSGIAVDLATAGRPLCCSARVADRLGFDRADLWRYHALAATFLETKGGQGAMERGPLPNIVALLNYATLLGLGRGRLLQVGERGRTAEWDRLTEYAARAGADARHARRRAERAERELAAVYQSRSWKVTAPLRRLGGLWRLRTGRATAPDEPARDDRA
ncbi:MAG TPA: hypothetical protein VG848_06350 [Acetobacteraceae bacterium]|nr:hypothetical protein [Acetobacteraceae bacterium]